jgi:ubiquinone/menaquinone biosynthesis C-methylase UbiE
MMQDVRGREIMDEDAARRFNQMAKTAFAPVNPAIARQIIETCGVINGTAIDIGSGPAHLAIELARNSGLQVFALDISESMRPIARENIRAAGLADRVLPVTGDVAELPFRDASADLIISKGSMFFWRDLPTAFREIYRVLRTDGQAFLGGGFGSAEMLEKVKLQMDSVDPAWIDGVRTRLGEENIPHFRQELEKAEIEGYRILHDTWQFWIVIRKENP